MRNSSSFEHLDDADRRLVRLLQRNGRATYAALAPEVDLSQAAVRARVQRLVEDRLVDINGRVDPSVLGIGVFALAFIKVRGNVRSAAQRVTAAPEAVFATSTTGRSDLLVELRCRDHQHLFGVLDGIRSVDVVDSLESVVFLQYFKQDWSETDSEDVQHASQVGQATGSDANATDFDASSLDSIDFELLRALMADGRRTYAELSGDVGLSQAAVRERVLRLLDGAISIQAAPGPGITDGLTWTALMISTEGGSEEVAAALSSNPQMSLVASTTGRFDLVCEVRADDAIHLSEVLDQARSISGVRSVEAVRYLETLKQDFSGGLG